MSKDIVKCRFGRCVHESKDVNKSDAVLVGKSSYYHPDCYQIQQNIKEIQTLFIENINPNTPFAQLTKTIQNIVFQKGIDSAFLLFGLQYYINHKITLNYPGGLYYVIQNKDVLTAWKMKEADKVREQMRQNTVSISDDDNKTNGFTYKPKAKTGFAAILG